MELFALVTGLVTALFVHELGHLFAARCCRIHVGAVAIGIGPALLSMRDRDGTHWTIRALPVGGSCLFVPPTSAFPNRHLSFHEATGFQRASVFAAGPISSLMFSLALVFALIAAEGWSVIDTTSPARIDVGVIAAIAIFSLLVAAFNSLPLLPLDGGQLFLIALEAAGKPSSAQAKARYAAWSRWILRVSGFAIAAVATWFGVQSWS